MLPPRAAPIHLDFIHEIDGTLILVDSLRYQNSRIETFSITRLDWLATDFSVTLASGDTLTIPDSVPGTPPSAFIHLDELFFTSSTISVCFAVRLGGI